jgi:hypothetical protein
MQSVYMIRFSFVGVRQVSVDFLSGLRRPEVHYEPDRLGRLLWD